MDVILTLVMDLAATEAAPSGQGALDGLPIPTPLVTRLDPFPRDAVASEKTAPICCGTPTSSATA